MAWVELVVMMGMRATKREKTMFEVGDRVMLEPPKWAPGKEPTKLGRVHAVHPSFSVNIGKNLGTCDVKWDDGTIEKGFGLNGSLLKKINSQGQITI